MTSSPADAPIHLSAARKQVGVNCRRPKMYHLSWGGGEGESEEIWRERERESCRVTSDVLVDLIYARVHISVIQF